jgi:UDP-3-O-[3-hydroxymyristoyl] glucosamine N-acyltransferase
VIRQVPISLGILAERFGCELIGDPDVVIDDVGSLRSAGPRSLSFLTGSKFKEQLISTEAAAVVMRAADAEGAPAAVLISDNPYASFALMAAAIHPRPEYSPGIHASAVIDESAGIDPSAHIAANVVVGERSTIAANCYIGPGTVIGPDCNIGDDCRLIANVTLVRDVAIGERGVVHPGAVLGSDGFGNAMTPDGWVKVPQLGGVRIGTDVEIGANTAIDCGTLGDTLVGNGVRLDNFVHIGHNVKIGAHTALAGFTGIAGSTTVGERCLFAGQSGAVGHITICDGAIVNGRGMITKDVTEPGAYASGFPSEKVKDWNRKVAQFRRLGKLADRVRKLEKGEE